MIAVDANILVYSHRVDSPFHTAAKTAIESLRLAPAHWAIPWPCVHEFIAIVTHPKIFPSPTPLTTAFKTIQSWQANANLQFLSESEGYLAKLEQISSSKISGPKIHDARIAAICLHHGINELWTADRDFSAFSDLTTRNPLTPP